MYLNCVYHSHWSVKSGRVCDTKVEERENLKESRKVFAYPYFTPSGQKCPAEGIRFRAAVLLGLSALIRGVKWRRLKSPLLSRTPHGIAPVQFYTRLLRVPLPVRNDCSSLYLMAKMRRKSGPAMIGIFS